MTQGNTLFGRHAGLLQSQELRLDTTSEMQQVFGDWWRLPHGLHHVYVR